MAVYVTGDVHGELLRFTELEDLCWTKDDYIIVCGDFSFIFSDDSEEALTLDRLSKLNYNILFVDGNHENFCALERYRCEAWMGGTVQKIRDNVIHLMRGNIYQLEGYKVFCFGGAYSHDKAYRIPGESWWPQELPSDDERRRCRQVLEAANNQVDFVITHAPPLSVTRSLAHLYPAELPHLHFLQSIKSELCYKRWYFGHLHFDQNLDDNMRAIHYDVCQLETGRVIYTSMKTSLRNNEV